LVYSITYEEKSRKKKKTVQPCPKMVLN
jgi:hypothetical protein